MGYIMHGDKKYNPNRRHTCMVCGKKRFEKDMEFVEVYGHGARFVCKGDECPNPRNSPDWPKSTEDSK